MPLPALVGLYSPAPQCGKSTVARHLWQRYGYIRVPFAETLKSMIRPMLGDMGLNPSQIHTLENGDKTGEIHPEFPGLTLRKLYQTIGTEWGRNLIHQELWIKIWKLKVQNYFKTGARVVVEDVRFQNEFNCVDTLGGEMWAIGRKVAVEKYKSTHASESMNVPYGYFDHCFMNDETMQDLLDQIDQTMSVERDKP